MKIFKNGAPAGEAYGVDFREGTGVALTITDEPANGTTSVTVASSGSVTATVKIVELTTTAPWLKFRDNGDTATPVEFQNIAPDGSIAPTVIFRPTNGGGPAKEAWQFGIDTAASTPYRDFFLAKMLSSGAASDPDGLYGSYNGSTSANPASWGFGYAQPAQTYRLRVAPSATDTTQGGFAIHMVPSQTGKPLVVYPGLAESTIPVFSIDSQYAFTHRSSPSNRTVTDGVLNSTTTVTSATAAFTNDDLGRYITATGIPNGTYISAVGSATSITLSQAATATASSVSLTVVYPQTIFTTNAYAPYFQIHNGAGGGALSSVCQLMGIGGGTPATPTNNLEIGVLGSNNATLKLHSLTQGSLLITASGTTATVTIHTPNASSLALGSNSTTALMITTAQSVLLGVTAPALSATDGFPYIPATAGTPSGVPTSQAGFAAMRYDSTAHKLWIYDAGWKGVVVA